MGYSQEVNSHAHKYVTTEISVLATMCYYINCCLFSVHMPLPLSLSEEMHACTARAMCAQHKYEAWLIYDRFLCYLSTCARTDLKYQTRSYGRSHSQWLPSLHSHQRSVIHINHSVTSMMPNPSMLGRIMLIFWVLPLRTYRVNMHNHHYKAATTLPIGVGTISWLGGPGICLSHHAHKLSY